MLVDSFEFRVKNALRECVSTFNLSNFPQKQNVVVLGSSGHFGAWVTMVLTQISEQLGDNDSRIVAFSSHKFPSSIFDQDVFKTAVPEFLDPKDFNVTDFIRRADLVVDCRLPPSGASLSEQTQQARAFEKNTETLLKNMSPGSAILVPSSGAVYGQIRISETGLREKDSLAGNPRTIYADAKIGTEKLLEAHSKRLNTFSPRIFSLVGPLIRRDSPLVSNQFFQSAVREGVVKVRDGEKTFRNFAAIQDVVMQSFSLLWSPLRSETSLNVGSRIQNFSVLEFASKICKLTGARLEIEKNNTPSEGFDFYLPNLEFMNEVIGLQVEADLIKNLELLRDDIIQQLH